MIAVQAKAAGYEIQPEDVPVSDGLSQ
jgi:hypothetical protein